MNRHPPKLGFGSKDSQPDVMALEFVMLRFVNVTNTHTPKKTGGALLTAAAKLDSVRKNTDWFPRRADPACETTGSLKRTMLG